MAKTMTYTLEITRINAKWSVYRVTAWKGNTPQMAVETIGRKASTNFAICKEALLDELAH